VVVYSAGKWRKKMGEGEIPERRNAKRLKKEIPFVFSH
jgi:hypothetical protein